MNSKSESKSQSPGSALLAVLSGGKCNPWREGLVTSQENKPQVSLENDLRMQIDTKTVLTINQVCLLSYTLLTPLKEIPKIN